jgi:putative PIN family toxin of toxin-antitoxin system
VRVLPDVNILARANEKSSGLARELLLVLIARRHIVLTSADILIELARVLRYPIMQTLFGLSEEQIYQYIQFLKGACLVVPASQSRNFPIRDASDSPILRAAIAGDADIICTRDKDFYTTEITVLCGKMGITVLDDISLMHRLRS